MKDKEQHDMQICKRTKDRPRAIQHSHQSKHLIMVLHTTHLTNIAQLINALQAIEYRKLIFEDGKVH